MNKIKTILLSIVLIFIYFSPVSISAKNYPTPYKSSSELPAYNPPPSPYEPYVAENGSYRGQISERTNRPKNTYVDGYQRKDGTHVRGHYKSKRR